MLNFTHFIKPCCDICF